MRIVGKEISLAQRNQAGLDGCLHIAIEEQASNGRAGLNETVSLIENHSYSRRAASSRSQITDHRSALHAGIAEIMTPYLTKVVATIA